MKKIRLCKPNWILGLLVLVFIVFGVQQQSVSSQGLDATILARVEVTGMLNDLGVPVYAHLTGADGKDYALVIATVLELNNAGVAYTPLQDTSQKQAQANYLIALERIAGARQNAAQKLPVLHDDGRHVIVCVTQKQADTLTRLGFEIEWMSKEPLVLQPLPALKAMPLATEALAYDEQVAEMIGQMTSSALSQYVGNLSGVNSVTIGGTTYTITTRNSNNTTWSPRFTQYAYEFFQAQGLATQYHSWSTTTGKRNVIATKTGGTSPSEIVVLCGHLDDMPSSGTAPGADDNASGSVGVMLAAQIMKNYQFERTVRFVLFTGEEQGLLGSAAYANKAYSDGDNIVAVLNLDMIAWDSTGGPVLRLHTRTSSNSGYAGDKAIADQFTNVVGTYGLSGALTPTLAADGESASDHASFWNKGYSALLAIEDDANDFCAYYHTANDKLSTLNMTYYTNYAKAVVGTAAHLAKPVSTTPGPTANFTFTTTDLTAAFQDTSACNGCTITAWNWNFGDGSTSTLQNPSHTYAAAGTYTVTLTVTNNTSQTDSISKSVTVPAAIVYCASKGNNYSYEWISQVTVGAFSNSSTAAGYTDFTSKIINVTKGQAAAVALKPGFASSSYTEYWKIWADLNRDGIFGSGEELFSGSGTGTVSGSIAVPLTALIGATRLRVSMKYNAAPTACETFTYGEVEDYTLNITEGGQTDPTANFTFAANGLTVTFTDTSTAGSASITNWSWNFGDGNTSADRNPVHTYAVDGTYPVSLTVTDANSKSDSVAKNVSVAETPVVYCTSSGTNFSYEWIAKVVVGSFTNSSGAAGYSDFTSQVLNLNAGQGCAVTLTPGFASSSYREYWRIWIDFNQDGDFADTGEQIFSNNGTSNVTGTLTIPTSALTGNTRMRVSMRYNSNPTYCGTFSYGEVEDYTVNIGN